MFTGAGPCARHVRSIHPCRRYFRSIVPRKGGILSVMRLLIVADSAADWPTGEDGRYDLSSLVREHSADALISLGDFSSGPAAVIGRAGAPFTAGVYGNHCTQDYMPANGIVNLVGDRSSPSRRGTLQLPGHRDVSVLAVQGCVRYKPDLDDMLFTQTEYSAALDTIGPAELVITHSPPAGINDAEDAAHQGIAALREWVDRHQPRWLLHGHTYENPERSQYGNTEIIYVHGHAVIELSL